MSTSIKNLSNYRSDDIPDAGPFSFGIVVAEWNPEITHALYEACVDTLIQHGAKEAQIFTIQVPGSFELPSGARILGAQQTLDAVICLGCVIKGETDHDVYISQAVAQGLTHLSLSTGRPHVFGVLTTHTEDQARARAGGVHGNKGTEAAVTAIRMAYLKKTPVQGKTKRQIGFNSPE